MFSRLRRPEVTPEQLVYGLRELGLSGEHLMVHASLRSFGHLRGGVGTLLGALRAEAATLVAPAFSYSTLLSRPEQPPRPFGRDTRVSRDIGALPQAMVSDPLALRSFHPTLSFVALGERAAEVLAGQSLDNPYAPVGALRDLDGLTVLIGVEHSSNTAVHYGEHLAGLCRQAHCRCQQVRAAVRGGGLSPRAHLYPPVPPQPLPPLLGIPPTTRTPAGGRRSTAPAESPRS